MQTGPVQALWHPLTLPSARAIRAEVQCRQAPDGLRFCAGPFAPVAKCSAALSRAAVQNRAHSERLRRADCVRKPTAMHDHIHKSMSQVGTISTRLTAAEGGGGWQHGFRPNGQGSPTGVLAYRTVPLQGRCIKTVAMFMGFQR